jgi:hypothetical protein
MILINGQLTIGESSETEESFRSFFGFSKGPSMGGKSSWRVSLCWMTLTTRIYREHGHGTYIQLKALLIRSLRLVGEWRSLPRWLQRGREGLSVCLTYTRRCNRSISSASIGVTVSRDTAMVARDTSWYVTLHTWLLQTTHSRITTHLRLRITPNSYGRSINLTRWLSYAGMTRYYIKKT